MDAPNYAQWHVDADNRAAFESWGHDMAAELVADAEIDNTVFAGIRGVTRAMHVCRGNAPGGRWLANGGFEPLARGAVPPPPHHDPPPPRHHPPRPRRLRPPPPPPPGNA